MISSQKIIDIVSRLASGSAPSKEDFTESTPLVGSVSNVDSMILIELCLELEDIANELGFEFDWKSEKAMSSLYSIFKDADSLANEFNAQYAKSKKP